MVTTANTPSPVPDFRAKQKELATQFNATQIEAIALDKLSFAALQRSKAALDEKYRVLEDPASTPEQKAAATAAREAANAAYEETRAKKIPYIEKLRDLRTQNEVNETAIKKQEETPTSPSPPASETVAKTEKAAVEAGQEAAKTTDDSPGSPAGYNALPKALPVPTPVTQTNIDNTNNLAQSPEQQGAPAATPTTTPPSDGNTTVPYGDEGDPNDRLAKRLSPPPVHVPSNIIEASQEPEIVAQKPVFTPAYPGALAAQTDGTVIGRADDPSSYDNSDRLQTEANNATAEAAQNSVIDNNNVKKNNTVVSAADDLGAYADADRKQTEANFAESVQNTEDVYPKATGNDLNGVSFPNNGAAPPAQSPGVALASGAKDWRFRIQLAPEAKYFYNSGDAGILAPLADTNGVIFPYTPQISLSYAASYNNQELTHSNYKIFTYKSSSVESMTIAGDFTAQDTQEANYLLAVIHFFKSVTKMFYGLDENPQRGIPPPLCYLTGFGVYQFDMHPVVITNFTYAFPVDVDYVNAYPTNNTTTNGGQNNQPDEQKGASTPNASSSKFRSRLRIGGRNGTGGLTPGGLPPPPVFSNNTNINQITRVPSKITIQLTCQPIVTRNAISNKFSLAKYSTGKLLQGSVQAGQGGGIW